MKTLLFTLMLFAAPPSPEAAKESARLAYEGHQAIERQEWLEAATLFRKLERAQKKSNEPADASLYWQAYALSQAKRPSEVRELVERLLRDYPESTWADDARSLVTGGEHVKPVSEATREEDALMALDALLAASSERAVPLLKKVLAGDHSEKVKARALFVLTQVDSEVAEEQLLKILSGSGPSRVKAEAIRMIATGGRSSALDRLMPYFDSNDRALKDAVIDAWIAGDRGDLLRRVAERERDPSLRRRLIDAMGAVGDRVGLTAIAKSKAPADVRADAIRAIGIAGGKEAGEAIAGFYSDPHPGIRRAVIEGLIICEGGKQLVELYRVETDRKMKREILHAIAAVSDEDTLEVIERTLDR